MEIFFKVMVFVLGLVVGSFINMALWRVGNKKSFFKEKRSFCDFCGKKLKWFDNIPVISWVVLRGKSRCCGKKLPLIYPVIEIMTGILFLVNYQLPITGYLLLINFVVLALLVFEAAFDFKHMMLPDGSAYALIVLALIRWLLLGMPINYMISGVLSALFIFILHKIKIKGRQAMGDGDIFLALFMGLFLGFPNIVVAFYVAFIVGAAVGLGLILKKKIGRLSPIPFGPFLILGTLIAYYWGEEIIKSLKF